jgi:hypothetical protein
MLLDGALKVINMDFKELSGGGGGGGRRDCKWTSERKNEIRYELILTYLHVQIEGVGFDFVVI